MSISVTVNNAHRISMASEFFMARRPIMDCRHALVAHELLFCHTVASDAASTQDPDSHAAGVSVIGDLYRHGLDRVLGQLRGLVHIDAEALKSDIVQYLPPQSIVLVIGENIAVEPKSISRIAELTHAGFAFALDVMADSEEVRNLLPMVEIIRIDITNRTREELRTLCNLFKSYRKKLLAEKVESIEQFKTCTDLGFDYFQGYYFAKPQLLPGKDRLPSQQSIAELMALVDADADTAEIEKCIKGDPLLALNLLRLANEQTIGPHRIESFLQVLMALGRNQLRQWLESMLHTEPGQPRETVPPLMLLATARGKLMELLAHKGRPGNRGMADTAYTVGIMSLMDVMFNTPMQDLLNRLPMEDEVNEALLQRKGYFGELLQIAEYTEWVEKTETLLVSAIAHHRLTCGELYMLQLAAFEWSDQVVSGMSKNVYGAT